MNLLKKLRKEKNIKALSVCVAIECSYQQLMRWEAGAFIPVDKLRLLAVTYQVDFHWLIDQVYPAKEAS